jgi:succinyl-diaminopimelate desuccinylase
MTKDERIAFLKEMLAIDTANGNEKLAADYIAAKLLDAGIPSKQVEFAPNRNNLIAEIGGGGEVLALSGHLDVVPAGDLSGWDTDPFVPTVKDNRIYARGADDMKSGLCAMVIAMIELKQEKVKLSGRVRLLATAAEETGMRGAAQLAKGGYVDDAYALIVGEPTGERIVYAHKGILDYTVTSRGLAAHSSKPQLGVNAIDNLLAFYGEMTGAFKQLTANNPALGKITLCNSIIDGGIQSNVVPDFASFTANVRTIPEANNAFVKDMLTQIVDRLNKSVPNMDLEIKFGQDAPPMFSDTNSKLVTVAKKEAENMFGKAVPLCGETYATDAARFQEANANMQIIVFGPSSGTLHQANEYADIDSYLNAVDLYKNIIKGYFGD